MACSMTMDRGNELAAQYRKLGLKMLSEHATLEADGMGIEAGVPRLAA
jgi:hypothetical protein